MTARAFADERRAAILDLLERASSVQVADLSRTLGVSTVTVRADLDALERDGKLRRTHGGAVSLSKTITVSIQDRRVNVNAEAKRTIAREAVRLVSDGDSILVDSGTTALEFVRALAPLADVTVFTADLTVADVIDRSLPAVNVILLGGSVRKGHRYLSGPLTIRSLEMLHPDCAFVCPTSFVPGRGFMTNYAQMAEVKERFLECAASASSSASAPVGSASLMTTSAASGPANLTRPGALAEELAEAGTRLILAGETGDGAPEEPEARTS